MKVTMSGNSVTYYANYGQHVIVYKLGQGEVISVESENILAFTQDCRYDVRFIGVVVILAAGAFASDKSAGPGDQDIAAGACHL